jgi:hypothetical protein
MINWYLWLACMPINFVEAIFPYVEPRSRYLQRWTPADTRPDREGGK